MSLRKLYLQFVWFSISRNFHNFSLFFVRIMHFVKFIIHVSPFGRIVWTNLNGIPKSGIPNLKLLFIYRSFMRLAAENI